MSSPLQRLYQTKLALLATICTVAGVALLLVARWAEHTTSGAWLTNLPVTDVGSALFTTGLIAIFFEYIDQQDADERATQRLRTVLAQEAPAIRDAVIQGFAFDAKDLARVSNPQVLDNIARNVLAIQLGDRDLATNVYDDLRDQVIRAPERWHDVHISVALAPWAPTKPPAHTDQMFVATVRWEYRTVPASPTVRFACVSNQAEYRDLLRDPTIASVWYFGKPVGVDAASREAYELVEFTVNGRPRPARRTERVGSQTYTVTLPTGAMTGQAATITCTYRVLVKRHGHLLYLDLPRPTRGLHVELAYGGCGIRAVNTLDFIASAERVRVSRTQASAPSPSVDLGFDGWVFPRSGVAFVWSLTDESATEPPRRASVT